METTLRPTNYIITIREKTLYQLSAKKRHQRAHTFCLASAADFGQIKQILSLSSLKIANASYVLFPNGYISPSVDLCPGRGGGT